MEYDADDESGEDCVQLDPCSIQCIKTSSILTKWYDGLINKRMRYDENASANFNAIIVLILLFPPPFEFISEDI